MGKVINMLKGEILKTTKKIKYTYAKNTTNRRVESLMKEIHPAGYKVIGIGVNYVIIEITE